ncbi:sarcosine oxidase subunit gamma [Salinisphaera sp. USBA-960]|uniref:sarcosine oxidase subunit gamma n=1 Tax=Salinisphaera orenii TaxID=856731 RepID=UPI000DBE8A08|nr:sarcosine oxidase subunit gamma [Salifodinibacter halophilus]NNC25602.1 sarcosine oxidase subunit gamma [Salifodinibacter halophilus]
MPDAKDAATIPAEAYGPVVSERDGLGLVTLRGQPRASVLAAKVDEWLGASLPLEPNTAVQLAEATVMWLSPDAWLVVLTSEARGEALTAAIRAAGGHALASSHGRAILRLQDSGARDILAAGCAIDLHPSAFAVDTCVQTLLARMPVLLHRVADQTFDLYVPRSYARSMRRWLAESA